MRAAGSWSSDKTINMEVGVLRLLLKRAKTWTLVADDVKLFPKHPRIVAKVLTREQKAHLFRVASSRPEWMVAYCAAVLAVSTTCRSVELKNLRWTDVDIFSQTMRVRRSKTEAGHRTIPLNRDATLALAKLHEKRSAGAAWNIVCSRPAKTTMLIRSLPRRAGGRHGAI